MAKIGVTGASGRLGNVLVRALLERGDDVRALILPGELDAASLAGLDIERVPGDVRDRDLVDEFVRGLDGVFHLAARIDLGPDRDGSTWATNIEGARSVVAACLRHGPRLVHCSSHAALDRYPLDQPLDERRPLALRETCVYHRAKAHAELLVLEAVDAGLDAVICSPATLTGPFDFEPSIFGGALIDLVTGKIPILLDVLTDYADARDVAAGMIAALGRGRRGERYLLSGEVLTMPEVSALIEPLSGRRLPRRCLPLWVGWAALPLTLAVGAVTRRPPLFTPGVLRAAVWNREVHHHKAAGELGFSPRPTGESFADMLEWFRERRLLAVS